MRVSLSALLERAPSLSADRAPATQSKYQPSNFHVSSALLSYSDEASLPINTPHFLAKADQLTRAFKSARAAEGIFATTTSRDNGANSNAHVQPRPGLIETKDLLGGRRLQRVVRLRAATLAFVCWPVCLFGGRQSALELQQLILQLQH